MGAYSEPECRRTNAVFEAFSICLMASFHACASWAPACCRRCRNAALQRTAVSPSVVYVTWPSNHGLSTVATRGSRSGTYPSGKSMTTSALTGRKSSQQTGHFRLRASTVCGMAISNRRGMTYSLVRAFTAFTPSLSQIVAAIVEVGASDESAGAGWRSR